MKNFLIAFTIFLLWSALGIWFYSCKLKGLCFEEQAEVVQATEAKEEVVTKAAPPKIIQNNIKGVIIRENSGEIEFLPALDSVKQSFFDFLNRNQEQELVLTGLYTKQETDSTALARANKLKQELVGYGLNTDRVLVSSELSDLTYNEGAFEGGITYTYREIPEERSSRVEKGIANKILYSGFASNDFRPDNSLLGYTIELKNYLEKYPAKKVTIIGHTDNVGESEDNEWIGQQRANSVMRYLVSQGVSGDKITAISRGENEPIDDNRTQEGRRKNRRIEIKIN